MERSHGIRQGVGVNNAEQLMLTINATIATESAALASAGVMFQIMGQKPSTEDDPVIPKVVGATRAFMLLVWHSKDGDMV